MKKIILLIAVLAASSCATVPQDFATICYMPFDRASFGPIDRNLIEKTKCTDVDYTDILYKKLSTYLEEDNQGGPQLGNARFDEQRVRLKFVAAKSNLYFVDADGVVIRGDKQYLLSSDNKNSIRKMLATLFDYND
jgi:hypothetical protein